MFTAALSRVAKLWEPPSVQQQQSKYRYTVKYILHKYILFTGKIDAAGDNHTQWINQVLDSGHAYSQVWFP